MSIKETMENSFEQYAGMTIVDRAICDARDMLKPSARMSMYAQYLEKITPDKTHKKSQKSVAAAMDHFYVHGDLSLYPMLARLGKPFAMRYTLEDFQGNTGTIEESDNEAASRYTEMRLAPLSMYLFNDIEKETIDQWYDNYTGEEQYPAVLPSKGYYNIVNGTSGIATGIASSIPQFNLREVNEALIKLLHNPDIDVNEILCMPDFAGGGLLLNENEVRESLIKGSGCSCKLRAKVEFDKKNNRLIVTETPYGVYTSTIRGQLNEIVESEDNPGIDRFLDFSTTKANIEIDLTKKANVNKVIQYLYKNTSIQYHYPINMVMLDMGKVPKVFGWKDALQAHIDHERLVYRRGFEYDLRKLAERKHILDGYLICLARIEEVVQTIKKSESTHIAKQNLMNEYLLDEVQATAVLKLTLSRLAHLEVQKIEKELQDILNEMKRIESILGDAKLLDAEVERGLCVVAKKFGDERRTTIMNIETDAEDSPVEVKQLQLTLTNKNNLCLYATSNLYTQKRGGVGAKMKMDLDEYVLDSQTLMSTDTVLLFSKTGNLYAVSASDIPSEEKVAIEQLTGCAGDHIIAMASLNKKNMKPFILFITKKGYIKKSQLSEYNIKRSTGVKALNLEEDDEIISVLFLTDEKVGMLTSQGNFVMVDSKSIRPIGRVARGIKGIKLNDGDFVVSGRLIKDTAKTIISISKMGMIKQTAISEFNVQGTNTKGSKIQKLNEGDSMADFLPINDHSEIMIASTTSCIKIKTSEIPLSSKAAIGVKSIKLNENSSVVALS